MTAGLRAETAGTGLRVMSIQPGATTTELGAVGTKDPQVLEEQKANPWNIKFLDAADVAQSVVFALSMPRSASINEILIRPEAQGN